MTVTEQTAPRSWKYWTEPSVVDVQGVPTAYRRSGEGETVVYLHGGGATRAWWPFHQALADGCDLIAPEHPGFGDTPRPAEMDSWTDWVLFYDAFLRTLDLDSVHLVGNSLGGWLAANLAVYYPERFKSLTLIVPAGVRVVDEPLIDVFRMTPEEELEAGFNGRGEQYADDFVQEGDADAVQAYLESTTSAYLMWNPRYDWRLDHRLSRVAAPTLVVGAEDDRVIGNASSARYAELIGGAEHLLLPGPSGEPSSHMMFIEQPRELADVVLAHIRTSA